MQLTNLSRVKQQRTDSYLFPSSYNRYCDVFFVGNVFESFWFWAIRLALRNLDNYVLCGESEHGLVLGDPGNEYWITKHGSSYSSYPLSLLISRERCLELSNWMNVYKMFAFTAQHVVIEVPQRSRIAYLKTFKKISHIKHIAIPMTRGSYKRLTWPEGFGAFMVNRCAVLWCGRDFELRLHTVTCLVSLYIGKQHRQTTSRKTYKMAMNWAQVTQKEQQQVQVSVRTIYFYIYAYTSG